jgi:hypothetical protein
LPELWKLTEFRSMPAPVPLNSTFEPAVLIDVKPLPGNPVPCRIVLFVPTIHASLVLRTSTLSRTTLPTAEGERKPDQLPELKCQAKPPGELESYPTAQASIGLLLSTATPWKVVVAGAQEMATHEPPIYLAMTPLSPTAKPSKVPDEESTNM